jgi:hypothetical protein
MTRLHDEKIIVYCGVDTSDDRFEAVNWPDGTFRGYRDAGMISQSEILNSI